jgi:hypothetical protein
MLACFKFGDAEEKRFEQLQYRILAETVVITDGMNEI